MVIRDVKDLTMHVLEKFLLISWTVIAKNKIQRILTKHKQINLLYHELWLNDWIFNYYNEDNYSHIYFKTVPVLV